MSDDIKSLLQMLRYWETEPCLPGPAKTCKEARELIEQQAARIAELEARIAANGAEPIYQARQHSDEEGRWDDVHAATHSACAEQPQFYKTRIVYAAPASTGPRYDWSASGMKQSETGNWVMAASAEKTSGG